MYAGSLLVDLLVYSVYENVKLNTLAYDVYTAASNDKKTALMNNTCPSHPHPRVDKTICHTLSLFISDNMYSSGAKTISSTIKSPIM